MEPTVYVSEDSDFDTETRTWWWTGRFSCNFAAEGDFEDGPRDLEVGRGGDLEMGLSDVSVEEAIAWGRDRASSVIVWVGAGDLYSAGPIEDPTMEPWPDGGLLLERRLHPNQEHLLRSESDPPIWWDVVIGIGAPGMDRPGAVERLIEAVHGERPPPRSGLQGQVLLKIRAATAQMAEEEAQSAVLEAYQLIVKPEGRQAFQMGVNVRPSNFQGFVIE